MIDIDLPKMMSELTSLTSEQLTARILKLEIKQLLTVIEYGYLLKSISKDDKARMQRTLWMSDLLAQAAIQVHEEFTTQRAAHSDINQALEATRCSKVYWNYQERDCAEGEL